MVSLINRIEQTRVLYVGLILYLAAFVYGFLFLHQAGIGNRIVNAVWDLGHVLAFAILMVFVIKLSNVYMRLPVLLQFLLAGVIACMLGLLIEFIQLYTGRSFSLNDVLLNVIGVTTAIAFFSPKLKTLGTRLVRLIRLAVVLILLLVSRDAMVFSYDAYQASRQFPVLIDLSTPYELTRCRGQHVRYDISKIDQVKVLRAEFLPAKYATLIFDHFPRDWSMQKNIKIVAYNPDEKDIILYTRIHDLAHFEKDSPYSDRYNDKLVLTHGWNTLTIPLDDIRQAPRQREMDMRRIHQLMFYFPHLDQPRTLLIQKITLTD